MRVIEINSEDQAWSLLRQALNSEDPIDDEAIVFDFNHWLNLNIYLPQTKEDASITPTMMAAMVELQTSIHRSFALISNNAPDLRYLTKEQKDKLEFRVKVGKGSSIYDIDFTAVIEKIGLEAVSKMDAQSLTIVILGLALIFGGSWAFRGWLAAKADQRIRELDVEERKAELEALTASIHQNSENTRIMAAALHRQPVLLDVEQLVEPARQELVQAVARDGGGQILGTRIDPLLARELANTTRQTSEDVTIKGMFSVVRVDTTSPDGFRVTLAGDSLDHEVTASLFEYVVSTDHREAIKKAEWEKVRVYIELSAKKLRGRITEAVVTLAEIRPDVQ